MSELRAFHRSRPLRVAYLVQQDDASAGLILSAIMAECRTRWAGRFSLIVPCANGRILGRYQQWIKLYDPDVIYSYVDLQDQYVEALHRELYPSFLVRHQIHAEDPKQQRAYRPSLPFAGLSSLSLLARASRRMGLGPPQPARIADRWLHGPPEPFVDDNFGGFGTSFQRWPFPRHLWDYGRAVTMIREGEIKDSRSGPRPEDETVDGVSGLLEAMSKSSVWTMDQLAAIAPTRKDLRDFDWSRAFSLIVGDTFLDRVVYWNSRFLYPNWRDDELVTLRLPTERLDDAPFIRSLATLLNRRNHVSDSGNQPRVAIRSSSVPTEKLEQLLASLRTHDRWGQYFVQPLQSVEACTPSDEAFEHAIALESRIISLSSWREATYTGTEARIEPTLPEHLRRAPPELAVAEDGAWATDVALQRAVDHSPYDNVAQLWQFPRSLRISRAFISGYQLGDGHGHVVMPRVSQGGILTIYATPACPVRSINIPDDPTAFTTALIEGRDWWPFAKAPGDGLPSQICQSAHTSENGRYFDGVLGLFGGLASATKILLHRLWYEEFERVGASSRSTDNRLAAVSAIVSKRFGSKPIDPRKPEDMDRISRVVLAEARRQRLVAATWDWQQLSAAYRKIQDQHWAKHPEHGDIDPAEWRENERRSFARCVKDMCSAGVLHQGLEWRCPKCFHKNWISIDDLKQQTACEVCGRHEAAPIEGGWHFRMNEFLAAALREHGVLALVWAITKIRSHNETSFYYQAPIDLFFEKPHWEQSKPDAEVDLIAVVNGVVHLCEVKHSSRSINIDAFVTVAKRLRPNVATLAIMESHTPEIAAIFAKLQQHLSALDIRCELKTFEAHDLNESPTFGSRTFRLM